MSPSITESVRESRQPAFDRDAEKTVIFPSLAGQRQDTRLKFIMHWCPRLGALAVMAFGLLSLLSWIVPGVNGGNLAAGQPAINVWSGLAFVFCGLSLILLQKSNPWLRDTGRIFALIVAMLGFLGFCGHLFASGGGALLPVSQWIQSIERFSGQSMLPAGALNFFLVGLALLLLDGRSSGVARLVDVACTLSLALCLVSLLGTAFMLGQNHSIGFWLQMDPLMALAGAVMAASTLSMRSDSPLASFVMDDSAGGVAMRRLLPAVMIVPLVFVLVRNIGGALAASDIFSWGVAPSAAVLLAFLLLAFRLGLVLNEREALNKTRLRALLKYVGETNELYNNAACGFQSVDAAGTIVEMNDTELEWLGYGRDEVVGKLKVSDLMTDRSLKNFQTLFPLFLELGWVRNIEFDMVRKDGGLINVLVSSTAIKDENGNLALTRSIVFDISEQKKKQQALRLSQEHFRLLVENVQDYAIFVLDPTGRVMTWNKGAEHITGFRRDDILGKSFASFYSPEEIVQGVPATALEMASAADQFEHETSLVRRDGSKFSCHILLTASRDDSGAIIGFMEIVRDLTETNAAREEIGRLNDSLKKRVRDLSAAYEELKHLTDRFLQAREKAQREPAAGVSEVMPAPALPPALETCNFDLLALVEDSAQLFAEAAQRKKLSMVTFVAPGSARLLAGDSGKIRLILYNLIDNAVKFTAGGEIAIRATAEATGGQKATVRISVSDTGPGLDAEDCARLFSRAQQGTPAQSRSYFRGMGLTVCRELVDELGGRIGVESSKGSGAAFWVSLPCQLSLVAPEVERPGSGCDNARIIVVSASESVCEVVGGYAGQRQIRCDSAPSGRKALAAMRQAAAEGDPYQLALIGPSLPDMSAASFSESVRYLKDLGSTRLLLLTGHESESMAAKVREFGYLDYLVMPVRQKALLELISRCLRQQEEEGQAAGKSPEPEAEDKEPPEARQPGLCRLLLLTSNPVEAKLFVFLTGKLDVPVEIISKAREVAGQLEKADYSLVLLDCDSPVIGSSEAITLVRKAEGFTHAHIPVIGMSRSLSDEQREKYKDAGLDGWLPRPATVKRLQAIIERWLGLKCQQRGERRSGMADRSGFDFARPVTDDFPFELRQLRQIYDSETVRDILEFFLSSTSTLLKDIDDYVRDHDGENLATVAHQLKQLCSCIHFSDLAELSSAMEQEAKTESWFQAELVCEALKSCFRRTEGLVKQTLA